MDMLGDGVGKRSRPLEQRTQRGQGFLLSIKSFVLAQEGHQVGEKMIWSAGILKALLKHR